MGNDLENRLIKLERTNKLLISIVLLLTLFLVAGAAIDRSNSNLLRAERIEIVDAHGNVKTVLGTDKEGANGLFVFDDSGVARLSLTQDKEQSALFIYDEKGTTRIGVAQFAHGGGGLALHGADSKGAAVLYYKTSGSLSFYSTDGNVLTRIPSDQ